MWDHGFNTLTNRQKRGVPSSDRLEQVNFLNLNQNNRLEQLNFLVFMIWIFFFSESESKSKQQQVNFAVVMI